MTGRKTRFAEWLSETLDEFRRPLTLTYHVAESDAACCVGLPRQQQTCCK